MGSTNGQSDSDFMGTSSVTQFLSQPEFNALIREQNISKKSAEFLASSWLAKNLLQPETKITYYRKKEIYLLLFSEEGFLIVLFLVLVLVFATMFKTCR